MTDLADFLLARIAEDEDQATESCSVAHPSADVNCLSVHPDVRRLAECDAKRRIVEGIRDATSGGVTEYYIGPMMTTDDVLWLLALPYANHPDYREEWKP